MLEYGTGKLYVKKDGSTYFMCSSKCMSNFNLGRLPRRTEWTEKGKIQLKKV